ncbi:MAG: hypothetical protein J6T48_08410 [Bacteroidales bacterium]|nr:hypothetical protein [Bacteroidales bacterium]
MAGIKAIVYESNTGFTKEYAELLSEIIGIPAIPVIDNSMFHGEREPVIFLGWVCAGKINGIRMARLKFNPVIIAGVGMTQQSDKYAFALAQQNNIDVPFYYLQGGLHRERLKGFYKIMFKMVANPILRKAEKGKSQLSEHEQYTVDLIKNGGSFVKHENLEELIKKYKEINSILKIS